MNDGVMESFNDGRQWKRFLLGFDGVEIRVGETGGSRKGEIGSVAGKARLLRKQNCFLLNRKQKAE